MPDLPYMYFYPSDWLRDTRLLTASARGAWIDMICVMWTSPEPGTISLRLSALGRLIGTTEERTAQVLDELTEHGVCDREDLPDGRVRVSCRRVIRDYQAASTAKAELSKKRAEAARSRWHRAPDANAMQMHSKCTANGMHSILHTPYSKKSPRELSLSTPAGGEAARESTKARKRKPSVAQAPPSRDEWRAYAASLSPPMPADAADDAFDHYVSVGWVVGKAKKPMRDWQAAVHTCHRNWRNRGDSTARPGASGTPRPPTVWALRQRIEAMDVEIRELESRSPGPHCSLADFLTPSQLERLRTLRQDRQQLRRQIADHGTEGAA